MTDRQSVVIAYKIRGKTHLPTVLTDSLGKFVFFKQQITKNQSPHMLKYFV